MKDSTMNYLGGLGLVVFMFAMLVLYVTTPIPPAVEAATSSCAPIDHGNGVLYFPCKSTDFANALSGFKEKNPGLRVTAMTGDGTGMKGYDVGYFVSVEER